MSQHQEKITISLKSHPLWLQVNVPVMAMDGDNSKELKLNKVIFVVAAGGNIVAKFNNGGLSYFSLSHKLADDRKITKGSLKYCIAFLYKKMCDAMKKRKVAVKCADNAMGVLYSHVKAARWLYFLHESQSIETFKKTYKKSKAFLELRKEDQKKADALFLYTFIELKAAMESVPERLVGILEEYLNTPEYELNLKKDYFSTLVIEQWNEIQSDLKRFGLSKQV